jgi:hypothetical protein
LKPELNEPEPMIKSNVILHLKCGLSDISSSVNDHLNVDPSVYTRHTRRNKDLQHRKNWTILLYNNNNNNNNNDENTDKRVCAKTNHQMTV